MTGLSAMTTPGGGSSTREEVLDDAKYRLVILVKSGVSDCFET